ncbi:multicopper oxidase domain-containing protein [Streptomyces sp. NPDC048337]|uniref:multicopper oxidase domain-containing protein n=1 Tax=Streptomyces sp. NPDC048337 TaxID=3365535 RepID=UPI003711F7FF
MVEDIRGDRGPGITRRVVTAGAFFGALALGTGIGRPPAGAAASPVGAAESPEAAPAGPNWGLTKFLDPLRIPSVIRAGGTLTEAKINLTTAQVRLHSQLPPTTVWAYNGQYPGPTIDVPSGKDLRVSWTNSIETRMPLVAVQAPAPANPTASPGYRDPGGALRPGHTLVEGVAELPAWTVTHLHGAPNNGGSDGWPHNAGLTGTSQISQYPNLQPSAALFYHDHAMAITRYNVHAGLVGMYLVRDAEEKALALPTREVPLILSDRNVDTDPATGALTGQLLFKIPAVPFGDHVVPAGFTGPFNTVNGVIWPYLNVEARWYRFRLLNASNGRIYTLNLVDENGTSHNDAIRLIGTDGGLLPAAAPVPAGGLTVAPAERFDVLIDFRQLKGLRLRLTDARTAGGPTDPDLMQFRVEDRTRSDAYTIPAVLSPSYYRVEHGRTLPEDHDHVWVALVMNQQGHPEMWDLEELASDPGGAGIIQITDPETGATRTFRKLGALFDDTVGVYINHNRWAVWNFIHVGPIGPVHPMHIHLTRFQALFRRNFTTTYDIPTARTTAPITGFTDVPLEKYEEGWKDTVLVNRGQWVAVAGKFDGGTGQFVYHCHTLDHEDDGMMRPFVVHPAEVARFHAHSGPGHHEHGAAGAAAKS